MASTDLESFIDETIRRSRDYGYHPTTFIGMRQRYGTVTAISRLVISGDIQSGFKKLVALNLREWTIENAVMKFPDEFSLDAHRAAEWRLSQAAGSAN